MATALSIASEPNSRWQLIQGVVVSLALATAAAGTKFSLLVLFNMLAFAGVLACLLVRQIDLRSPDRMEWLLAGVALFFVVSVWVSVYANPSTDTITRKAWHYSTIFAGIGLWLYLRAIRFREGYFWWGISACAALAGGYGIYEFFVLHSGTLGARVSGPIGKPILYGAMVFTAAVISAAGHGYFAAYLDWRRYIPWVAALLGISGAVLSGSRGVLIFLPVAVLMLTWQAMRNKVQLRRLRNWRFGIALFAAIGALGLMALHLHDRIQVGVSELEQIKAGSAPPGSISDRFVMWTQAVAAWKDSPLLGIGPGAFGAWLEKRVEEGAVAKQYVYRTEQNTFTHVHNEYLEALGTRGLVGVVATLGVLLAPLLIFIRASRSSDRSQAALGVAGTLLILGFLHYAMTESVLFHIRLMQFYVLTVVVLVYLVETRRHAVLAAANDSAGPSLRSC